ncbi:MAG: hypothetical protein U0401_09810 [Anaerolineae bacterium]
MTAEITTVIGQLNLVGGAWRGDAPNQVAVREPKSAGAPGAGKGDLFVLVEVRGAKSDYTSLEQKLAGVIRDSYYLGRGSVTASLRRALQGAGDLLYKRNLQVNPEERVVAGAVALVLSGEDAFVAQIGPAALFAVLGDHIQRHPAKSVWLDEALPPALARGRKGPESENETALGLRAVIEPNLYHLRVSPQDVLVLADSGLAGQLPLPQVVKAVDVSDIKTMVKNLGQAAQANNCSALVLMVIEETSSALGAFIKKAAPPIGRKSAEEFPAEMAAGAPALNKMRPSHWLGRLTGKAQSPAQVAEAEERVEGLPVVTTPPFEAKSKTKPPRDDEFVYSEPEPKVARDARVMASMAHGSSFEPRLHSTHAEPPTNIMKRVLLTLLLPVAMLGKAVAILLNRAGVRDNEDAPRQAGTQAHRPSAPPPAVSWKLLLNLAIAIPILVAVIVGLIYWQKGRQREAEYQEFLTSAQGKVQEAQAGDAGTALGLMGEAEKLLIEAEKIKGVQPEITELRQKIAEQTDTVGKVQRLYYLPQLRQYTDAGTNLKNIVVQGVELYVLDMGTDRIFHHRLDDVGETLLPDDNSLLVVSRGQTVNEVAVGDMVAMTWMPAGGNRQTSDLVVLNTSGLLEYNPSWGVTTAALTRPDNVAAPVAVDSFFGNLYVLDPPANRLWRYLPTADGYSAAPQSYFPDNQTIDLTGAVDLAIDGAIYVLFKDGRIGKFEGGQAAPFNLTGLDKPLSNPVAIFTAPNETVQHLYIADAGNRRVVQLNKDGVFVRQFKPREGEGVSFANLQDIYVDEIGERLYVLDSNNLYLANIPNK